MQLYRFEHPQRRKTTGKDLSYFPSLPSFPCTKQLLVGSLVRSEREKETQGAWDSARLCKECIMGSSMLGRDGCVYELTSQLQAYPGSCRGQLRCCLQPPAHSRTAASRVNSFPYPRASRVSIHGLMTPKSEFTPTPATRPIISIPHLPGRLCTGPIRPLRLVQILIEMAAGQRE